MTREVGFISYRDWKYLLTNTYQKEDRCVSVYSFLPFYSANYINFMGAIITKTHKIYQEVCLIAGMVQGIIHLHILS